MVFLLDDHLWVQFQGTQALNFRHFGLLSLGISYLSAYLLSFKGFVHAWREVHMDFCCSGGGGILNTNESGLAMFTCWNSKRKLAEKTSKMSTVQIWHGELFLHFIFSSFSPFSSSARPWLYLLLEEIQLNQLFLHYHWAPSVNLMFTLRF